MLRIALMNNSTVVTNDVFNQTIAALRIQIGRDLSPAWGVSAHLYVPLSGGLPLSDWEVRVVDDQAQAEALGLENSASGIPRSLVYADTEEYWTVSFSHQVLEMMLDPFCNTSIQVDINRFAGLEICDPVAGDDQAYRINRTKMSNFVLPSWFEAGSTGPWDHAERLTGPLTLSEGGYQSYWENGVGWSQDVSGDSPRASRSYRHNIRQQKAG